MGLRCEMAALTNQQIWITPEDYLSGEQLSDIRHEYACGKVYAMAGAGDKHNYIAGNLFAALNYHLSGTPCSAFVSDMKIRMDSRGDSFFYYPDVMVACDPSDNEDFYRRFPKVIVEVLSPSTERIDSSEKLRAYLTIPSLEVYILISQKEPTAILFRRVHQWRREVLSGREAILEVPELNFSLGFERLYERTGLV